MICPQGCGSQAADKFHCPDCGWESIREARKAEMTRIIQDDLDEWLDRPTDPEIMDEDLQTGGM